MEQKCIKFPIWNPSLGVRARMCVRTRERECVCVLALGGVLCEDDGGYQTYRLAEVKNLGYLRRTARPASLGTVNKNQKPGQR